MKFKPLLKKLLACSTHPVHRMSCVIAKNNKIISIGFNKYKTSPRSPHPYKMIHCELAAILDNKFADLKGTTAYVYREHHNGTPALSRPCPSCWETLRLAGIKKVCYNDINGNPKEEKC